MIHVPGKSDTENVIVNTTFMIGTLVIFFILFGLIV